ncbi:MAG: hypothetical protein PVI06_08460, partial [Desulfobacterales bacterium]
AKWKISALNLFESRWQAGRVFKAPATSFRLIKNVLDKVKKDLSNNPFIFDRFISSIKNENLTPQSVGLQIIIR